jgi:hypothetical protein
MSRVGLEPTILLFERTRRFMLRPSGHAFKNSFKLFYMWPVSMKVRKQTRAPV